MKRHVQGAARRAPSLALAMGLIVGAWMTGASLGSASAKAACVPGRTPHDITARWVYLAGNPNNLTGISSKIEQYSPYYSGSNDTGTNSSVMLVDWNIPGIGTLWSQFGWNKTQLENPGVTHRTTFTEFFVDGFPYRNFWPTGEPIGDLTNYKILYTSPRVYEYYKNGSKVWDDVEYSTPEEWQVMGETHDKVDQMPGEPSAKLHWNQATYYTGAAWSSHTISKDAIATASFYDWQRNAAGDYYIWDEC